MIMPMRAGFVSLLVSVAMLGSGCAPTDSRGPYPNRPVRVIIPFGPGGLADVTMRLASEALSESLGQPVLIENRPGAGGVAATSAMLNAEPDGYTLIVLTNGTTIAETLYEDLPYDVTRDLAPISAVTWFDLVLLTHPDSGIESLADAVERGRSRSGIRIATINPGSTQNLTAEYFASRAGIAATVIPYRTTPDVLGALLRNEVDIAVDAYTALKGPIDSGQVRALAVTGTERNPAMADVPTVEESGVGNFVVTGWNALYTHAGVPTQIVDRLHDEIEAVAARPDIQEQFRTLGVVARPTSPDEMQAQLLADIERWREVIEASDIGLE